MGGEGPGQMVLVGRDGVRDCEAFLCPGGRGKGMVWDGMGRREEGEHTSIPTPSFSFSLSFDVPPGVVAVSLSPAVCSLLPVAVSLSFCFDDDEGVFVVGVAGAGAAAVEVVDSMLTSPLLVSGGSEKVE